MARADRETDYALSWKRFAWFVLLWLAGVLALGAVALGLKVLMAFAGLTT
jgi:Protein of unknown function (DUF2474)